MLLHGIIDTLVSLTWLTDGDKTPAQPRARFCRASCLRSRYSRWIWARSAAIAPALLHTSTPALTTPAASQCINHTVNYQLLHSVTVLNLLITLTQSCFYRNFKTVRNMSFKLFLQSQQHTQLRVPAWLLMLLLNISPGFACLHKQKTRSSNFMIH